MHSKFTLLLFICSIISAIAAGQDTLRTDSTKKVIISNPGGFEQSVESVTFAHYDINNKQIAANLKGTSLLHSIYGQAPNISPYFENQAVKFEGFRYNNSPVLAIDGITANSSFLSASNLTTFDFENISVTPDLNGAASFGVFGSNGALMIESKSGKNDSQGTAELNSFTENIKSEFINTGLFPDTEATVQSTAIAVQRDFGSWDARISANHSSMLSYKSNLPPDVDYTVNRLNLNANVGYEKNKTELRAIVRSSNFTTEIGTQDQTNNFFQSLLKFKYNSKKSWRLSSNLSYRSGNFEIYSPEVLLNLTINEKCLIGNTFFHHVSTYGDSEFVKYAGMQVERYEYSREIEFMGGGAFEDGATMLSAMAGLKYSYRKAFHVDLNARTDDPTDNESEQALSIGVNVLPGKLLNQEPTGSVITSVRFAAGHSGRNVTTPYPSSIYLEFYEIPLIGRKKNSVEGGLDLTARNARWELMLTCYRDRLTDERSGAYTTNKGIEMIAKINSDQHQTTMHSHSLLLNYSVRGHIDEQLYTATSPDFGIALLSQIRIHKLTIDVMPDWRSAAPSNNYFSTIERSNILRLRYAGVAYEFEVQESILKKATVSVVARNFMISNEPDPEGYFVNGAVSRSIGLNLNFIF